MPFDVELTGSSDYTMKPKIAVCGFAGAGKTLLSSTAPSPFYIFFREEPRLMSVARRYVAHTKITNLVNEEGRLIKGGGVEDRMREVVEYLRNHEHPYETVVIDTADELQQALKESRKLKNRGSFAIADWGWLGDVYREIMNAFIDLPMNVLALFHLKQSQEGEDGQLIRELALQGAAKDEAPGWFDIVGVIDSYETVDEKGVKGTARGFATRPSPRYPFLKDHSGQLPSVFDVSDSFVGDWDRIYDLVYGEDTSPKAEHETVQTIAVEPAPVPTDDRPVPSPAEVAERKAIRRKVDTVKAPVLESEVEPDGDGGSGDEDKTDDSGDIPVVNTTEEILAEAATLLDQVKPDDEDITDEEARAIHDVEPEVPAPVEPEADGEMETTIPQCEVCDTPLLTPKYDAQGQPLVDASGTPVMVVYTALVDLGQKRYKKVLCTEHLKEEKKRVAGGVA